MKVSAEALRDAVVTAAAAADRKSNVNMFRQVCFRNGLVSAFDGQTGIVTRSPLKDTEVDCCIAADRIEGVVRGLSGEVDLQMDGTSLVIRSGRNRTRLQTSSVDGFPQFLPTEIRPFYDGDDLRTAIKAVLFCAGGLPNSAKLSGVGLRGKHVVATDGVRICRQELSGEISGAPAVLPFPAAKQIVSLGQPDKVFTNDNVAAFLYDKDSTVVVASLSAGNYPFDAVDQQINRLSGTADECVLPEDTVEAVNRVCGMLGTQTRKEIVVENGGGELCIRCQEESVGTSEESLSFNYQKPFKFKIDAGLFVEAMTKVSGVVDFADVVHGEKRALRFSGDGCVYLLALRAG